MSSIINKANLKYTLLNETYERNAEATVTSITNNVVMNKIGSPNTVTTGSIITYTVTINVGSTTVCITNGTFKDELPSSISFVAGSLKVNNVATTGDITVGIPITLTAGSTTTIEYKCTVL